MLRLRDTPRSLRTRLLLQFVVLAGAAVILVGVITTLLAGADLGALIAPLVAFWGGSTIVVLFSAMHLLDREVLAPLRKLGDEAEEMEADGSAARRLGDSAARWDSVEFAQLSERYRQMAANLLDAQSQVVRSATRLILDSLANFSKLDRGKVIIDHVEEHTVNLVQEQGYWAGMTLYPESKCTPNRAIDMLETCDASRLWLNSACDWGVSDPLAVVKCGFEMKRRKHTAAEIDAVLYDNPKRFLSQSKNFVLP